MKSIFSLAATRVALGTTATLFLATVAPSANAAVIQSPISATATSQFSSEFDINNTIDQSGLDVGFISGVTDFDAYLAQSPFHSPAAVNNEWFTPQGVRSAVVTYNLGRIFAVDRLALWNEESSGIGSFNLLASLDGISFSTIANNLSPANNPRDLSYLAQVFSFGSFNAQYIRLDISGCPQPNAGFDGCGIGEVAFSTTAADTTIPTPALLPGLIGMGVAALRKRGQDEGKSAEA